MAPITLTISVDAVRMIAPCRMVWLPFLFIFSPFLQEKRKAEQRFLLFDFPENTLGIHFILQDEWPCRSNCRKQM